MKIYKKIGIGLGLAFAILSVFLALFFSNTNPVLAATVDSTSFSNAQYVITTFENNRPKTISTTIGGVDYIFTDTNTSDTKLNLKTNGNTGFICSQGTGSSGITLQEPTKPLPGGGDYYSGQITLNYSGDTNEKCKEGNAQKFLPKVDIAAIFGVPGAGGTETPPPSASYCNLDSSLDWLICPILEPLSSGADTFNNYVSGQLNFSVEDNLPDGGSVHKAWAIFKNLVSAVIVIVMLIMIISQTAGDLISAYTFKKLLPKLVVAVIAMQLSWELCIWLIGLANDLGRGVAELLAVPFGGLAALELPDLLNRLSIEWSTGVGITATSAVLGSVIFAGPLLLWGWPLLLFAALMIIIALVAALATLLFRNALIVLLVILSPLGFLAWVLPGSGSLWKKWKDNFVKLLLFFPLVMAMIYGGRIFAWIAGGLGAAGPLDLLMVLIGFFGPYFLLPKSFKWGGDFLAKAATAVDSSFPIKKGREVATRELISGDQSALKRKQSALIDKYYKGTVPGEETGKATRQQRLRAGLKRGLIRTAGGHPIPTARSTWVMMQRAGKWKGDEIALAEGKMNNDYKEFQRIPGVSVQRAKELVRDKYWKNGNPFQKRSFLTWAYNTKSFMEMGQPKWRQGWSTDENGNSVPPVDKSGKVAPWEDMVRTQDWIDFLHGNPQAYSDFGQRLGAFVPYRLPLGGGPSPDDYLPGGKNADLNPSGDRKVAWALADSERFRKTIDQAEDPSAIPALRPEHFEELKEITESLKDNKLPSSGAIRLKEFIEEQSRTLAGRNLLQRLSGAAETHIDAMFGPGYLASKLEDYRVNPGGGPEPPEGAGGGSTANRPNNPSSPSSGTINPSKPGVTEVKIFQDKAPVVSQPSPEPPDLKALEDIAAQTQETANIALREIRGVRRSNDILARRLGPRAGQSPRPSGQPPTEEEPPQPPQTP